jgi:hypothetical protein
MAGSLADNPPVLLIMVFDLLDTPAGGASVSKPSQAATWQMPLWLTFKYQLRRRRGTFGAHDIAICPESSRSAEISVAGQATC